jgi:hypothetical protein
MDGAPPKFSHSTSNMNVPKILGSCCLPFAKGITHIISSSSIYIHIGMRICTYLSIAHLSVSFYVVDHQPVHLFLCCSYRQQQTESTTTPPPLPLLANKSFARWTAEGSPIGQQHGMHKCRSCFRVNGLAKKDPSIGMNTTSSDKRDSLRRP